MKKLFKKIITFILAFKVKKLLKKSNCEIIAITGSVGKTTCKKIIADVLASKFSVLESSGGFNTPLGILLSILNEKQSGFSNFKKWFCIIKRAYTQNINLPQKIVLEVGVDKKGDMKEILKIIQPDITVITKIAPAHLGKNQFNSLQEIFQEKSKLAFAAKKMIILNQDCSFLKKIKSLKQKIVFFSKKNQQSNFFISSLQNEKNGFSFSLKNNQKTKKFFIPLFGDFNFSSFIPAIIIAQQNKIPLSKVANIFKKFTPLPGRGKIFKGVNGSIIWDLSYNSSPLATEKALSILKKIPAKRYLALLGNMNELGKKSFAFHKALGQQAACFCDQIFFVGTEKNAFKNGVKNKKPLAIFPTSKIAGERIKEILKQGDLILVKGSQNNVFLEKAIEKLLLNKKDINNLCRKV